MHSTPQIDTIRSYHVGCGFGLAFNDTLVVGRITMVYPDGEVATTVTTIDGYRLLEIYMADHVPRIKVADQAPSQRDGFHGSQSYPIDALMLVSGDPLVCWAYLTRKLSRATQEAALGACLGIVPFTLLNSRRLNALVADPRGVLHRQAIA